MGEHKRRAPMTTAERVERKRQVVTLVVARTWLNQMERARKSSKLVGLNGEKMVSDWPPLPPVQHLWPFDEYLNRVELRPGNPPSDSQRPVWLRGLPLWVDASETLRQLGEKVRDRLGVEGPHHNFGPQDAQEFLDHYFGGKQDAAFH